MMSIPVERTGVDYDLDFTYLADDEGAALTQIDLYSYDEPKATRFQPGHLTFAQAHRVAMYFAKTGVLGGERDWFGSLAA